MLLTRKTIMDLDLFKLSKGLGIPRLLRKRELAFENLDAPFGVKAISKVDLMRLGTNSMDRLQSILKEKGMIIIPSHRVLSENEQLRFTSFFGKVSSKASFVSPHTNVESSELSANNTYLSSNLWHCDEPYLKNPPHISVFQLIHISGSKWKTSFQDVQDLCTRLNDKIRASFDNLQVMYERDDVTHPLLWIHPFNGKQTLYIDFRFVKDVFDICVETGDVLLKNNSKIMTHLNELLGSVTNTYEHLWLQGDILIVDNYAISRKAVVKPDYDSSPLIRRTTTEGIYF
jgi:alpha-ketoglutarate-dependent taurine dioxygenase